MDSKHGRPWYCIDQLVREYKYIETGNGDFEMLKALKTFRWISLNIIIGAVGAFAIYSGGDPTLLGGLTVLGLTLVNGVEWADWVAARQALKEVDHERESGRRVVSPNVAETPDTDPRKQHEE